MNNNYDPNQQQYQQPQYQQPQYQQPQYQQAQYQQAPQQYQYSNQQYQQQYYQDPNQQYYQQQYYQQVPYEDPSAFSMSIVSAAFSITGILSIVGFILAIIAKSKLAKVFAYNPNPSGKMKAANIISKISFGIGLGFTIYMTVCFMIGFLGALANM